MERNYYYYYLVHIKCFINSQFLLLSSMHLWLIMHLVLNPSYNVFSFTISTFNFLKLVSTIGITGLQFYPIQMNSDLESHGVAPFESVDHRRSLCRSSKSTGKSDWWVVTPFSVGRKRSLTKNKESIHWFTEAIIYSVKKINTLHDHIPKQVCVKRLLYLVRILI